MFLQLASLIATIGLLALRPASDSIPGRMEEERQVVSATLVTEPGHRVLGEGTTIDACAVAPSTEPTRIIILLDDKATESSQYLASLGSEYEVHRHFSHLIQGMALTVDPASLHLLRTLPGLLGVYPDVRLTAALADSVPLVGAPQVWSLTDGNGQPVTGQGVQIAIVDSGVDYTHTALGGCLGPGCKVAGGYDYINDDGDPWDDYGHGTHVAGIAAADGLLRGVAPDAKLLAYKILNEDGVGYASDLIAALEQAVLDGADVINISLSGQGSPDDPMSLATQAAVDSGCVVAAVAGNHGPGLGTVAAPGIAPGAISVAAAGKDDIPADFSSRGPVAETFALKPDLIAPGVQISSSVPLAGSVSDASGWKPIEGTSMATPHVAGAAALLRQLHPGWSPAQVKSALMNYALDLGADAFTQGAGRLDLPDAATPDLLAVPGSLSFGLPLLDGTQLLTVTVSNLATTTLAVTPTLTLARVADGAGRPLSPTLPVSYAIVAPGSLALAPALSRTVTVTLDIPPAAADGHYQGQVHFETPGSQRTAHVHLGFSLLSRVTVRVLDESGQEIDGWGHMAVLARVPQADVVVSNMPLQVPATFTVPSGDYYAQAFGRFGIYDNLLIPGLPAQVPYVAVQSETIAPHAAQTITLDLADTRSYWLDATDVEGNPAFINAWSASLRYRDGTLTGPANSEGIWLTRLGQSYIRVLSTDLPHEWPAGFPLRLSDTPPGVSFGLALQGVSFSPDYREFVTRHGPAWPAAPYGGSGFPLVGSADLVELLGWERPVLDASTPPTFTVSNEQVMEHHVTTDIPGLLDAPWIGWEASAEGWLYPPTGARSSLEPVAPGLPRTLTVSGTPHTTYWAGSPALYRIFHNPLYGTDWSQTRPWDKDGDVYTPLETTLEPLVTSGEPPVLGAGPLFPVLSFANQPGTIQMRHPLLAGSSGAPVTWGPSPPTYTLASDSGTVATGSLAEYTLVPLPERRWAALPTGTYTLAITTSGETIGIGPGVIRTGFVLDDTPGADLNPPQVLGLALPQRFDPAGSLTATWSLSDVQAMTLDAALRLGGGTWQPLAVEPLSEGQFRASIVPGGALTVSLAYTATDDSGNWLAWQGNKSATALAQVPATLTFDFVPAIVPWSQRPVTVRLVGSLHGSGDEPLANSPFWLRLEAGDRFVGYVRDLSGSPGSYRTGEIDFEWTFVPADLAAAPGPLPISLQFDVGLYAPQTFSRNLVVAPPLYLPIIARETSP